MQPTVRVDVEQVDGLVDLPARVLDILERLGGACIRRPDWMFWPTMMIGSSTSWRKLELIQRIRSCVEWTLSGSEISAIPANR